MNKYVDPQQGLPKGAEARSKNQATRTPHDGKPYYCTTCGLGLAEYAACDEPDCNLESDALAQARANPVGVCGAQQQEPEQILDFVDPQGEYERVCKQAEALTDAIDYALHGCFPGTGFEWLQAWQEGDAGAIAELEQWKQKEKETRCR